MARIKHYSIFYKTKKVAYFQTNDLGITSGDEPQFGDEGFLGYSDGAIQTSLQTEAIVTVAGTGTTILEDLLTKKEIDVGAGIVDGKILTVKMRVLEANYKSDAKAGTLMGTFRFGGGAPKVAG